MACFNPILAVDNGVDPETGKHKIKFLPKRADFNFNIARERYGSALMMMPCGHCVSCAQEYARMWQARIMCEAEYYQKKCFLTLTYRKEPKSMEVLKTDLRKFIKDIRNKFGAGIKFYGCGEKGELSERKHAHLILFGVDFMEDSEIVSKRGLHYVRRSPSLEKIWSYGFVSIGDLDVDSAGYVSQYCNKKKLSFQDNGEFVIMSRGLGRRYFEDHKEEIFQSDYLYLAGNKFKIPRYFSKLMDSDDIDFYYRSFVWDYKDRKRLAAEMFRYNSNKGFSIEEVAMKDDEKIALNKVKAKEGCRDVIIY